MMSVAPIEKQILDSTTTSDQRMENGLLLSRLPEDLIHHILSFLTTEDAVKVSLASNSLQAVWLSSCPALQFQEQYFFSNHYQIDINPRKALFRNLELFNEYVSNTMARVSFHKINLQSFRFQTSYLNNTETLDKWIGIALDSRVREISLSVRGVPYTLPERLLVSSTFLKSLSLAVWGKSELLWPNLLGSGIIDLPCLQSLSLVRVSIDEGALQRLLKGCPALEHLRITPPIADTLSQLSISHLKLKSLNVENASFSKTLDKIKVEAPCLEEFHCSDTSSSRDQTDLIVKSSTSKNLKCISLLLTSRSSKQWLSKLLPRCTSLETLRLELCYDVETKIKISNPYVKNIVINYIIGAKIEIDCPMLLSLRWTAGDSSKASGGRSLPSLSMINHQPNPNFAGYLHMPHWSHTDLNSSWFHKLREFLSTSRIAAMSLLCRFSHSSAEDEADQNGDNESLPTSAVKIEQLYLMVISGLAESCYTFIMNGFLSTCHPDTIHLAPPPVAEDEEEEGTEPIHFIEVFCEKLENWKDGNGCYCSSEIICWKHQLKSVEIQEFSKVEDKECHHYEFDGISKANLPILPEPPSFRLKFQWY